MGVLEWVVYGVVIVNLAFMPVMARKQWRGEVRLPHDPLQILGPRGWRAFGRTLPIGGFLLPACVVLIAPAALHDRDDPVWMRVLVVLAGVLFASGFVGVFTVALFNRPKRIVPPDRRAELGLVYELRHRVPPPEPRIAVRPVHAEVPVAGASPPPVFTIYRSRRLLLRQVVIVVAGTVFGVAALFVWLGPDTSTALTAGVVVALFAWSLYRMLAVSVMVDDRNVIVTNLDRMVTLSWDEIDRFEIRTEEGPGRHWQIVVLARDGEVIRMHALEGAQLRPRSHDVWAREVVAKLNAQLRQQRGAEIG